MTYRTQEQPRSSRCRFASPDSPRAWSAVSTSRRSPVEELDRVLAGTAETLELDYVDPSADVPFIRSGSPFADLVFVQHGTAIPWQSPHSELAAPFLIGVHEFLMDAERWVGSYSAITEAVVVRIPKGVMARVAEELPSVRERMHELVMRRLARFYWVSLATSGAPASRVAAALVSRLAPEDRDFGSDRLIAVRQTDIARLTTLSRSGVSVGLAELVRAQVVRWGDGPGARFAGVVQPRPQRRSDAAREAAVKAWRRTASASARSPTCHDSSRSGAWFGAG